MAFTVVDRIVTCIVTGNRLFNGYSVGEHPVRQAYEMINMIVAGTISIGEEEFHVWEQDDFQVGDLLNYLAGRTTHADFFGAMEEVTLRYPMDTSTLVVLTYALDPERLINTVRQRYRRASRADERIPDSGRTSATL